MEVVEATTVGDISVADFLRVPIGCFRASGFELFPVMASTKREKTWKFVKNFYFWIAFANIVLSIVGLVMYALVNLDNMPLLLRVLPNVSNAPFISFKVMMLYVHKDRIVEVLEVLKEIFPKTKERQDAIGVKKYLRQLLIFQNFYGWFMILVFVSLPIHTIQSYFVNGTKNLPLDMWMPFAHDDEKVFFSFCVWLQYISFNVEILSYGFDVLMYAMVALASLNFDILKMDAEAFIGTDENGENFIGSFVDRHKRIFELCDKLETIYSATFLYSFVQSSFLICFVAFQLSWADESTVVMMYAPYMITACNQILLVCYLGQKLITSSTDISLGVYSSKWYELKSASLRRAIWLTLMRSQREQCLTAKKFKVISLESFTSILATAYSYFTLLRRFYSK